MGDVTHRPEGAEGKGNTLTVIEGGEGRGELGQEALCLRASVRGKGGSRQGFEYEYEYECEYDEAEGGPWDGVCWVG